MAPVNLRECFTLDPDREIGHARQGKPAHVILKMNSLTDIKMMEKLYEGSKAGVKIDLIVRGICCLRPGVKGVSENIRVVSIVGRFLEHCRVFSFGNDGKAELYLSSADVMGRNLDRRVELMFPIEDAAIAEIIKSQVLEMALRDNQHARMLQSDGSYRCVVTGSGEKPVDSQNLILLSRIAQESAKQPTPREPPQGGGV